MKGRLLFQERQRFKDSWRYQVVMTVTVPVFTGIAVGLWQEFAKNESPDNALRNTALVLVILGSFLLLGFFIWLYQVMALTVKVDQGTVMYSFYPFVSEMKNISKRDLKHMYVREQVPSAYGGYAYTVDPKNGKAYTVGGKFGLQLVFKNNKKLFLGTKRPKELEAAINKLKKNWGT